MNYIKFWIIGLIILASSVVFIVILSSQKGRATPGSILIPQGPYEADGIIVKYKNDQTPAALQQRINQRSVSAQTTSGRLSIASENTVLRLRGQAVPEEAFRKLADIKTQSGVIEEKKIVTNNDSLYFLKTNRQKSVIELVETYSNQPEVEYAEPNYIYELTKTPNDTRFSTMWGMAKIKAPAAWDATTGAKSIIAADIDTGIDENHEDLKANIVEVKSFTNCASGGDQNGHGTHTAGTIGAVGNNGKGVTGVNWQVGILALKVGCTGKDMATTSIAQAINYAVQKNAKVINMSLGGGVSQTMKQAIAAAVNSGTVVVVSAGNSGPGTADGLYPGSDPNVISVAATTQSDGRASFSSTGSTVDIAAPGVQILSTWTNGAYKSIKGTSMAAPHVTGLVALMFSKNPNLTPTEVRNIIQQTADDLGTPGKDPQFGYGRINAQKALERVSGSGQPEPTSGTNPTPPAGGPTAGPTPITKTGPTRGPERINTPTPGGRGGGDILPTPSDSNIVQITYEGQCPTSSITTQGYKSASVLCIDGSQKTIGDGQTCRLQSALRAEAETTCAVVATPTAAPTEIPEPTNTIAPTVSEPEEIQIAVNFAVQLQGVSGIPRRVTSLPFKMSLVGQESGKVIKTVTMTPQISGIFVGSQIFEIVPNEEVYFLIKGPMHIQKKICHLQPYEDQAGTYRCADARIALSDQDVTVNASAIVQLVGDIDQNSIVNSADIGFVRNHLGETSAEAIASCDVNYDGACNGTDYGLVIAAMAVRVDEE